MSPLPRPLAWLRRGPKAEPRDPLAIGAVAVAGLFLIFVLAMTNSIPFLKGDKGRIMHAEFETARQVAESTPVRVRGVTVGTVDSVEYDADRNLTEVAFGITDEDVELHSDASAALRWRTILGGRMELALDPGSPSAPALEDDLIELDRTRIQTEVEDITRVLDGQGAAGQQAFLQELPKALTGDAAGAVIDGTEPGLRELAPAARALRGERRDDLDGLISSSADALEAMEATREDLGELVVGAQQTLRTTADDRAELEATFQLAPAALDSTVDVAHAIDETLPDLDGLVAELRPGARALGPALAETRPAIVRLDRVLRVASPLLARLRPALGALVHASVVGRRVVAGLRPTVNRLAGEIVPYLERTDDDVDLPVYQTIGPAIASTAASAAPFIESGHVINFPPAPGENTLSTIPCTTSLTTDQQIRCASLEEVLAHVLGGQPVGARRSSDDR